MDVISKTLHGWYPEISQESCDSFAFHVVHNVLTIRPVIDGVYSLYYGPRKPGDPDAEQIFPDR